MQHPDSDGSASDLIHRSPPTAADASSVRARFLWIASALLGVFAVLRYAVLGEASADGLADLFWVLFSFAAGARSLVASRRKPPGPERMAWTFLAAGALAWFVGMLYLLAGDLLGREYFVPFPTPANWLFLSLAPLFTAGVLHLRGGYRITGWTAKRLANLGLVASGVLMAALIVLLEPIISSGARGGVLIFSILDPSVFVIALVFSATIFWSIDLEGLRRVLGLLVASIAVHTVADLLYFQNVLSDNGADLQIEVAWLIAFALQYWAALEHDLISDCGRERNDAVSQGGEDLPDTLERMTVVESLLPSFVIVGVLALALWSRDDLSPRVLLAMSPWVTVFVGSLGFRQWWSHQVASRLYQQLEEASAHASHLLAASPAVVFSCPPEIDAEPDFVSGNISRELGLSPDDKELWRARAHPEDRELVRAAFRRTLTNRPVGLEYRIQARDDRFRWVDLSMTLVHDEQGRPREIVGSIVDVTGVKAIQAQAVSNQRLESLGRLAGGIAHDFNNLLTAILGYTDLLRRDEMSAERRAETLVTIQKAGERAAALTRQLLTFSRKQAVRLEPVEVGRVVSEMTGMLHRLIGDQIEVDLQLGSAPQICAADPRLLEQVVMNLLINARDAMPEGGRVTISIDNVLLDHEAALVTSSLEPGRYVKIEVADTGSGMTAEVKGKVFEPFFTTKEVGKGTGLGLAMIHGIIEQHSGHIEVESEPGAGSLFRIYLPAAEDVVATGAVDVSGGPVLAGTETVLVVDDEESIPKLVKAALERVGYKVMVAGGFDEAVSLASASDCKIDVLLSDVVMPGTSGPELARAVRELQPEIAVVYMSGYAADPRMHSQVQEGEAWFIHKPITLGLLSQTLRSALDSSKRARVTS